MPPPCSEHAAALLPPEKRAACRPKAQSSIGQAAIDKADKEGNRSEYRQADEADDDAPMVMKRLDDRSAPALLGRSPVEGVPAQNVAGNPHQQPEQERDAPAPAVDRCGRRARPQNPHPPPSRAECRLLSSIPPTHPSGRGHPRARAQPGTPSSWYIHRPPRDPEKCAARSARSAPEADGGVSRQQADQESRDRHGRDRERECRAPSEAVADMSDQYATDRPYQIADRQHAECRKQLGDRILMREELATYLRCEVTVDREIVPFEHVPNHAGRNHPAHWRGAHPASCGLS